jgi:cell division protein FtsB
MKSTLLALVFIGLQYMLWIGEYSVWRSFTLHQSLAFQQEKNRQLLAYNLQLTQEISALKCQLTQPSSLLEDYIRWKLGFVAQGEWFCQW